VWWAGHLRTRYGTNGVPSTTLPPLRTRSVDRVAGNLSRPSRRVETRKRVFSNFTLFPVHDRARQFNIPICTLRLQRPRSCQRPLAGNVNPPGAVRLHPRPVRSNSNPHLSVRGTRGPFGAAVGCLPRACHEIRAPYIGGCSPAARKTSSTELASDRALIDKLHPIRRRIARTCPQLRNGYCYVADFSQRRDFSSGQNPRITFPNHARLCAVGTQHMTHQTTAGQLCRLTRSPVLKPSVVTGCLTCRGSDDRRDLRQRPHDRSVP